MFSDENGAKKKKKYFPEVQKKFWVGVLKVGR